jgi:phosphate transport system permease protein
MRPAALAASLFPGLIEPEASVTVRTKPGEQRRSDPFDHAQGRPAQRRMGDRMFRWITASCAGVMLLLIASFFVRLALSCRLSLGQFGWRFLVTNDWDPGNGQFGALSSLYGTLVSTAIAMVIAVPLSLVIALFLVELAPPTLRRITGTAIELLAAVPSIIFGMWGLFVFAPFMAKHVEPILGKSLGFLPLFHGPPMGIGMLTAGIILALMILPYISAVMRDVFQMVPAVVKESAYGMGATTWEVTRKITMRYGIRGLIGACFLGLGRAVGETMAVTFVIGNNFDIRASLFAAGNTIASTLANEFTEASEPIHLSSLVELGLILFVVSFILQVLAHLWLKSLTRKMGAGL